MRWPPTRVSNEYSNALSGCLDPSKNVLGLGKVSKWHPAREHDVYEHQHPLGRQVHKRIAGRVVRPVIGQLDRVLPAVISIDSTNVFFATGRFGSLSR